jgi:hypothetical protein
MRPFEEQFNEVHEKTMGHLDNAIKLTRGLADIYGNPNMSASEKDAAVDALHKSVAASTSTTATEHEYHGAMSQDPRYETPEAAEEKGNAMFKKEQENN